MAYGWDFAEPISYLIGLSLETFGLYYYLRRGRSVGLKVFFDNKKQNLMKLNNKFSATNLFAHEDINQEKFNYIRKKALFREGL